MNGFGSMLKDYLEFYKISQTDFADRLDISNKHMNEILNENTNISEELMLAISLITDIDVNLIFYVENKKRVYNYLYSKFENEENIKKFLDSFYLKEMSKKGWLILKDKESVVQSSIDLLGYLKVASFDKLETYMDERILYKKQDDANLKKIYLWIKRCDNFIQEQEVASYNKEKLLLLLEELKEERNREFNCDRLIKLFNKYGIYLVIEDALIGTKVRGCMLVKDSNPAIYMTKYLKEKSSFYFALYHELSHVKSDYNRGKNKIIVDDGELDVESKADKFAIEQMISSEVWNNILNDYDNKDKICLDNKIPLCFMYSRLARENIISYSSKEYNIHKEKIN